MCGDLRKTFSKRFHNPNGREMQMSLFQRLFSVVAKNIDDADTQLELPDSSSNKVLHDVSNKTYHLSSTLTSKKRSI